MRRRAARVIDARSPALKLAISIATGSQPRVPTPSLAGIVPDVSGDALITEALG
jgi:hypothetical protein